jgi:hypothetical protein
VLRFATHEALEEAEGKAAAEESDSDMSEDEDPMDDDDVAAHGLELVSATHLPPHLRLSYGTSFLLNATLLYKRSSTRGYACSWYYCYAL